MKYSVFNKLVVENSGYSPKKDQVEMLASHQIVADLKSVGWKEIIKVTLDEVAFKKIDAIDGTSKIYLAAYDVDFDTKTQGSGRMAFYVITVEKTYISSNDGMTLAPMKIDGWLSWADAPGKPTPKKTMQEKLADFIKKVNNRDALGITNDRLSH